MRSGRIVSTSFKALGESKVRKQKDVTFVSSRGVREIPISLFVVRRGKRWRRWMHTIPPTEEQPRGTWASDLKGDSNKISFNYARDPLGPMEPSLTRHSDRGPASQSHLPSFHHVPRSENSNLPHRERFHLKYWYLPTTSPRAHPTYLPLPQLWQACDTRCGSGMSNMALLRSARDAVVFCSPYYTGRQAVPKSRHITALHYSQIRSSSLHSRIHQTQFLPRSSHFYPT